MKLKIFNIVVTFFVLFLLYKIYLLSFQDFEVKEYTEEIIENRSNDYIKRLITECSEIYNPEPLSRVAKTYIRLYAKDILQAAYKWNIPPESIAGIIAAESSLNFDGASRLENYYFKEVILNKTDEEIKRIIEEAETTILYNNREYYFNKIHTPGSWSIGICQFKIHVGEEIETQLAIIENRPKNHYRDIIEKLLEPSENINFAAFYLSMIRIKYLEELNVDLNDRPSIYVTLFNIGRIEERIMARKENINDPITSACDLCNNEFGVFSESNEQEILSLLKQGKADNKW